MNTPEAHHSEVPSANETDLSLVIWDLDGTVWDWLRYAAPAYEAMCQVIADLSERDYEVTADAMRDFYTKKGTLEDEGLVQGLQDVGFFDHMHDFNLQTMIDAAQQTFARVRLEHLHVYPGISKAMSEIREMGLRQIILTDAPGYQAQWRLRHSNLSHNIGAIYAMPTATVRDLPRKVDAATGVEYRRPRLEIPQFTVNAEKPYTDLESVTHMTREAISRKVVIIGDNDAKDMELARRYDFLGVHAAYGAADRKLVARIQRFASPHVGHRNMQVEERSGTQTSRIKTAFDPSEIVGLLRTH